ncbi:hypothetical protein [Halalkalibacterium ligniniphilum]|uniref:hypothetical protein n=1 Tax=Halalkalibacterium ligniniphilum TaxID=1134413 RepID=UPI00036BED6A|nr:hypothetical protein [Halalkalibacterium ligniniphilum]
MGGIKFKRNVSLMSYGKSSYKTNIRASHITLKHMQDRLRGQVFSDPVKYLKEQCMSKKRVEGKTNFDALLENDTGIFLEVGSTMIK